MKSTKKVFLGIIICIAVLNGCTNDKKKILEEFAKNNGIGAYSIVEINHEPVLFVSEETYNDEAGRQVSFMAEVYIEKSGKVSAVGNVSGAGTAYPIKADNDYIWISDGKTLCQYTINEDSLELVKSITVDSDEYDNFTYIDNEGCAVEKEYYEKFYDEYLKESAEILFSK